MTCPVCGRENKPENRFCGSCGVAVSGSQSAATACSSCGNINEPGYKFCGKCGAKLERRDTAEGSRAAAITQEDVRAADPAASSRQEVLPKPAEKAPALSASAPSETTPSRTARADVPERDLDEDKPADAIPDPKRKAAYTGIGGPSFLGLGSDSENAEYLLEEEEGSSGSGRFRVLLAVLLLAGIATTIFLQARARHNAAPKAPELAKAVPADVAAPQAETPSATEAQNDANASGPGNSADADQHPRQPEASESESKTANAATPSADTPAKEPDIKKPDTKDDEPVESPAVRKSARQSDSRKEKLPVEPKPSMALVNAQRYLQGKGVRQNCAQGLQYLKTATEQKDPEATVQMAALYASGHCVRQDRVQAYKWFTSASELQPSNHWIEKNLNWLWADMTSAERQQISK